MGKTIRRPKLQEKGSRELPRGFVCRCHAFNRYPGYVYAHWQHEIETQCNECNALYRVCRGNARFIRRGRV